MKKPPGISINRLALYLGFLDDYLREHEKDPLISSQALATHLDINPHQIRKDLSYFGKFGERGIGYHAAELRNKIAGILGLNKNWNLCLCGMGNLGSALFAYNGFKEMRLNIVAVFDNDSRKIGKVVGGIKIYHPKDISLMVKRLKIDIAIIAVPSSAANDIFNKLIKSGIRAILNFTPVKLSAPSRVKLRDVNLSSELINLTYFLANRF